MASGATLSAMGMMGGGGGSIAGGSEIGINSAIDTAPILAILLPHGLPPQGIFTPRQSWMDAKISPFGLDPNKPLNRHGLGISIFDDVARILKTSPGPSGGDIYGQSAFPIQGMDVGPAGAVSVSAGYTPGMGGSAATMEI
jgi:hypothetical protein